MKNFTASGTITALVTPFKTDGSVDCVFGGSIGSIWIAGFSDKSGDWPMRSPKDEGLGDSGGFESAGIVFRVPSRVSGSILADSFGVWSIGGIVMLGVFTCTSCCTCGGELGREVSCILLSFTVSGGVGDGVI